MVTYGIKHKGVSGLREICAFNQSRQIYDLTSCLKSLNLCQIVVLALCKLDSFVFQNPLRFIPQNVMLNAQISAKMIVTASGFLLFAI